MAQRIALSGRDGEARRRRVTRLAGPWISLAAALVAGCQDPESAPNAPEFSGSLEGVARAVLEVVEREEPAHLREMPRGPALEARLGGDVEQLEVLLERLRSGREDVAASDGLSSEVWRIVVDATERGRARLAELRAIRSRLEEPLLGMRQFGQHLDPPLAGHLGLEAGEGFLVTEVVPDSPAAAWGIEAWDVVLSIDDATVDSLDVFWMGYESLPRDSRVSIEWIHRGQRRRAQIVRR
jgi:hypothetical protein